MAGAYVPGVPGPGELAFPAQVTLEARMDAQTSRCTLEAEQHVMGLIISQRAAGRKQMVKLCRLQTWRARRVLDYAGSMVQPPSHGKLWEDLGKHCMERFHVLVSKVEKFATLLKETLNKSSYSYNVYMHGSSVSRSGSKNPASKLHISPCFWQLSFIFTPGSSTPQLPAPVDDWSLQHRIQSFDD
ncbi:uncharacterized protein PADG_02398 [Paracoccidioides brasiliensis Pb18]|uniref:Uncharacterized protein n=1 Tax=Paracoccidioides brasiliensis (strain Pb18) TaxID=502780 RepID=C1G5E3_PARBD|nr:uncharacterized protein PADG_02398 [Paracoccidioides brasiliensis Pb18]EEH46300.2 hypothetical protein PADG_02398 [Paracoccidioides brasiliensis Pb18]ODH52457.1 hypothetical protein GX48_01237 [Paracoccidioides brasiliensis]